VSLPSTYPATSPPQMQLLSRYIGPFGVDPLLFGFILRTFISTNGVEWNVDTVCVFDGLQNVLERCVQWYEEKLSMKKVEAMVREDAKAASEKPALENESPLLDASAGPLPGIPEGIEIIQAEAITDRKSAFVGRACRISHPSQVAFTLNVLSSTNVMIQVPLILSHLMADRRISRAAHPIINAWRFRDGNVLHQGL
jgi:hypothetical protein